MQYDNPAARLLAILQEGKGIAPGTPCHEAWRKILQTASNTPLLMSRLGKVMELPQETIQALQDAFPTLEGSWQHWNGQVNLAFTRQNLQNDWNSFIGHIDTHTLTYLHMSVQLLEGRSTTKSIASEEILAVRERIQELYSEVISSTEIEPEVKKYLVRYLRKLLVSIDEYRLTGALPILESVETMVGHIHVDQKYKSFMRDQELGKRIIDVLNTAAGVVTVAVGLPQLTQAIQQLSG